MEIVLIVGKSNAGKSTLVRHLSELYNGYNGHANPTWAVKNIADLNWATGQILLGGRPLRSFNPLWLRQHLAVVQQSCSLLSGTIRDNVLLGSALGPLTADEVACDAMRAAGCYGACA